MDPSTFVLFWLLVLPKALDAQDDNFDITLPTAPIAFYLKSLANSELGVAKLQETLITAAAAKKKHQVHSSTKTSRNDDAFLQIVSEKLSQKWKAFNSHLNSITVKLENKLQESSSGLTAALDHKVVLPPCCATQDQNEAAKGCSVIHLGYNGTRTARIASEVFDSLLTTPEGSKRQFFISTDRTTHLEFPASRACGQQAYNWHRPSFVQSVAPNRKHVLIILDRGNSISTLQLDVGRSIAGYILESLQVPDQVALLTIDSSRINVASNQACGSWARASSLTKKVLRSHLSSINRMSYQRYDHPTALQKANELIQKVSGTKVDLFYITTTKSLHIKSFLDSYQTLMAKSTAAGGKLSMKLFLMDSKDGEEQSRDADLNLSKEIAKLCQTKNVCLTTKNIDSTLLLSYKIGDLFDFDDVETSSSSGPNSTVSLPWIDELGGHEMVLTLTYKVQGSLRMTTQAVIGLDLDYKYLFEDFFYHDTEQSYFCVLHAKSRSVIYHPRLLSHGAAQDQVFTQGLGFHQIESEKIENYTIEEDKLYNQMAGSYETEDKMYNWKHVGEEFIIVSIQRRGKQPAAASNDAPVTYALQSLSVPIQKLFEVSVVFHRLDVLPPQYQMKLCRHLLRPATLETGSVFLSPKAVTNPYSYLQGNIEANRILSMMRYLTKAQATDDGDATAAQKHHLQPVIRDQLQALAHSVLPVWKNMSFTSGMNNYIVRRFAATDRGLLMAYPGSPLPDGFDPLRQEWYLTAKKFPSKVVVTPPRLDQGGAGYVLTVSQYVSSSETQEVAGAEEGGAVISMDLTLGYINKMLLDTMPICQNMLHQGVRCFIFDHQGYLIVHPSQFDHTQSDIEGLHITQVEHLAVSLMLEDQTLVTRRQCKRFSDMTLQRYYHFNTSDSSSSQKKVWQNSDLDCWRYKVSMLPETNLFLAVLLTNSSKCASRADVTFCPHNPTRSCILCNEDHHPNQHQCESPCQCPLSQCSQAKIDTDVCSMPEPQVPPKPERGGMMLEDLSLPPCFDTNCKRHSSRNKCFGVIGCAWCEFELNGQEAFCSEEAKCFGGVWGSHWPYDRYERGAKLVEDDYFFRKTPSLVPIAGSVLSVILFLGISAYCIRNYDKCLRQPTTLRVVRRHARNGSILQAAASFEEVLEEQNQDELHELSNRNENVATTAIVSPYRINPGYRRPCATDSDHGYSTMTPMGGDIDSEIVPYVDSVPSRHRLQRHIQQRQQAVPSVTSGISSRTSSPTPNPVKKGIFLPLTTTTPSSSEDSSPIARGTSCQATIMQTAETNSTSLDPKPKTAMSQNAGGSKNQFVVAATVHMVDTT